MNINIIDRESLIKKAKIDLPVEFLKRWMVETNEQITLEQIEEDFDKYENDFRWQLIKEYLLKKQDIKVTEEEALEAAKAMALNQYMQYGISNVPDDYLENFVETGGEMTLFVVFASMRDQLGANDVDTLLAGHVLDDPIPPLGLHLSADGPVLENFKHLDNLLQIAMDRSRGLRFDDALTDFVAWLLHGLGDPEFAGCALPTDIPYHESV